MWSFIFVILMFVVFGKILGFAIKATWGMTKIIVSFLCIQANLDF